MTKKKIYLFDHSPHLRLEWNYERNTGIDPEKISYGSNKKVWWKCHKGHEKYTTPSERRHYKCAYCSGRYVTIGENDILTTHPDIAAQLVNPDDGLKYSYASNKKAMWRCEKGHEYSASFSHKTIMKSGCPACSGKLLVAGENDLATTHPTLSLELADVSQANTVTKGSSRKLQWICDTGHEYTCSVLNKTWGKGCPYCSNYKVLAGYNDLEHCFPDIARELVDPTLGKTLSRYTGKKVEWKCPEGHIYSASVGSRTNLGSGCPKCCTNGTSKSEKRVRDLLTSHGFQCNADHTHRVPVTGMARKSAQVDIEIIGLKVIVEYDGCFFHQGREVQDTKKTLSLLEAGYSVVRLREFSRYFSLPILNINHPNLLQLPVEYTQNNEPALVEAVATVVCWLKDKNDNIF